jgi:hypothetical protein
MKDSVRAALLNLYSDPRFRRSWEHDRLRYGTVDGVAIGAVLVTHSSKYGNFNINRLEIEILLARLDSGKIQEAYAVAVKRRTCLDVIEARELYARLLKMESIQGDYGEFWAVPGLRTDDDPFGGDVITASDHLRTQWRAS